jgi:hypothetical protein
MKAFPSKNAPYYINEDGASAHQSGMDLRDYFAAKAMPAIIQDWYKDGLPCGDDDNAYGIATVAYLVADAMMKAREK